MITAVFFAFHPPSTASAADFTEKKETVEYNWGNGSPINKNDRFTATFDQSQFLNKGDYFIQTLADDGIKVNVNGKEVINRWNYTADLLNKAYLPDSPAGHYEITTQYREAIKEAAVFSHVAEFGDWIAYYYPNEDLTGLPSASKVIKGKPEYSRLIESFGYNNPIPQDHSIKSQFPSDHFSARYVTSKRLDAGEYVIRAGADDGIQVLIDGKMVLDRFTNSGFREDAIKITVEDRRENGAGLKNTHDIEVRYKDHIRSGRIDFFIQPFDDAKHLSSDDGWLGEIFSNQSLEGNPVIMGGKSAIVPVPQLNFNWNLSSPSPFIPKDRFSARFTKKILTPASGIYQLKVLADDGVRVFIDDHEWIDSWKYIKGNKREVSIPLTKGEHEVKVEYLELINEASLHFEMIESENLFDESAQSVSYNWGHDLPRKQKDRFTGRFDLTQSLSVGNYFIQTLADDGIFVEANGEEKIKRWDYSSSLINRALLMEAKAGTNHITALYREGIREAAIYADVVKFGDWLAYYYPNETLSGYPIASKVLTGTSPYGKFSENHEDESPADGVPSDHFSARYVTAQKIEAGDYLVRAAADDGIQVFIDDKLVLDRFTASGYREDAVKVTINDTDKPGNEKDVHWIEIRYKDVVRSGKVDFLIQPYTEAADLDPADGWLAEYYPTNDLTGNPVIHGGKESFSPIESLNFNWGDGSPGPLIPANGFSSRFTKKINISEEGYYYFNVKADDGVKVKVDNTLLIDSPKYQSSLLRQAGITLTEGIHEISIDYFEGSGQSSISIEMLPGKSLFNGAEEVLRYNWGDGGPGIEVKPDNFTAVFDQSQSLSSGDYFMQTLADDGVSVVFEGNKIIDRLYYSSNSIIDRAILTGITAGRKKITTTYRDGIRDSALYSEVVKFGDWLAYYYPNHSLTGLPAAAKVIPAGSPYGKLSEDNGWNSPVPGKVPSDGFSALYSTYSRIPAGEYVLRTGADDGVQVYIDGKLVLDRFTDGAFREDSVKLSVKDQHGTSPALSDVHLIEVRYKEVTQTSRVEAFLQPYNEAKNISPADGWYGEIYPSRDFSGTPVIFGGKYSLQPIAAIDFQWGQDKPSPLLPSADNFSGEFIKMYNIATPGKYAITVHADDGIRVFADGKLIIDSWKYISGNKRQATINLTSGIHEFKVQYYDAASTALLKFELDHVSADSYAEIDLRKPADITAQDIINFFNNSPVPNSLLKNYAQEFINTQQQSGVNAVYLVAHSILETGWGRSTLAQYKRNFFGYGAYDTCPTTCAFYFPTGQDNINYVAYKVKTDYLMSNGTFYNGPTLEGMNVRYASDKEWHNKIAKLMQSIQLFDAKYYDEAAPSEKIPAKPPVYSREIPDGLPYPIDIYKSLPNGIMAEVNTDVNFRTIPYVMGSTLIKTISKGTNVILSGYNTDVQPIMYDNKPYDWLKVIQNGTNGWINGYYLNIKNLLQVNASSLNIRKDATTNSSSMALVSSGTYLKMSLDSSGKPIKKNGWIQVYTPHNEIGWVSEEFISIISKL
ncbi:glucosaminidase domain-containing protein [Cytobacillus firmus]|uniref:PA14 domain-containing protein n=1 Tax=Cytobacillus firmus TaxID=1399 RepID=UPI002187AF32|nr:PA14 domain-containing protein [Cytobacillus firmus]URM33424.1 glucosaminidase domain-containing protein [Cytobacillus firmus]